MYIFNQIFFVMNLKRNQILCSTNSAPNEYDKKSLTLILLILLWDLIPFSTIFWIHLSLLMYLFKIGTFPIYVISQSQTIFNQLRL